MTDVAGLTRAQVRALAGRIPPDADHLRPIVEALPLGLAVLVLDPGMRLPHPPLGRAALALVADDPGPPDEAKGPGGFHADDLRRFLRPAVGVVIVSGGARREVYATAVAGALLARRPSLLIETTERHEADWLDFVRRTVPGLPTLISTPRPQGRA